MYCHDKCYKGETQLWTLLTLGKYALYKIKQKYDEAESIKPDRPTLCSLVGDGRRYPTVRKYLQEKGLIEESFRTDTTMDIIEEEAEKLLEGFMKEPSFNTTGYIMKKASRYSYEKELLPVTDLSEVYRDVDNLNAYEIIYVYLHQDKYDFRIFSTTTISEVKSRSYFGTKKHEYTRHKLKIYPLDAIGYAGDASLIAAGETYALSHSNEALTATFGIKFRALDDKKEFLTNEVIDARVACVEDKLRLLHRTLKELKVLQRKAKELGDDNLKKKVIESGIRYVKRSAPLWINSKDKEKKDLSILMCKGAGVTTERTVRS